jgi:methylenetetrahydrofolate dehydrogenase (NADP+)/methenyltetrahydrofolate cyclohydrolase
MPIITSKQLKIEFKSFLQDFIKNHNLQKELEIIQIGNNLASTKYIQIKKKIGHKIGIKVNHHHFSTDICKDTIQEIIEKVKNSKNGLIFQLPVPTGFQNLVLNTPVLNDVDLLSKDSYLLLNKGFLPPTIGAIDLVLKEILGYKTKNFKDFIDFKLDFSNYTVAVIGQGTLVGKPAIRYFLDRQATILALNKMTKNSKELTKKADIVVCGAGAKDLVDKTWLKKEAIVIDASTSESEGKLNGDVNQENIEPETILSPSPGGIGKLTVLYLFWNLIKLSELKN